MHKEIEEEFLDIITDIENFGLPDQPLVTYATTSSPPMTIQELEQVMDEIERVRPMPYAVAVNSKMYHALLKEVTEITRSNLVGIEIRVEEELTDYEVKFYYNNKQVLRYVSKTNDFEFLRKFFI